MLFEPQPRPPLLVTAAQRPRDARKPKRRHHPEQPHPAFRRSSRRAPTHREGTRPAKVVQQVSAPRHTAPLSDEASDASSSGPHESEAWACATDSARKRRSRREWRRHLSLGTDMAPSLHTHVPLTALQWRPPGRSPYIRRSTVWLPMPPFLAAAVHRAIDPEPPLLCPPCCRTRSGLCPITASTQHERITTAAPNRARLWFFMSLPRGKHDEECNTATAPNIPE